MIAVDTNLLVYSHREDSPFHSEAKDLIDSLRRGSATWAVPWPCVHEFISVVTNPRIFKKPTPLATSFATIRSWSRGENLILLSESSDYFEKLEETAMTGKVVGARIHDARVAALCEHHSITELWTADRDFSGFPKLKTRNPLKGMK